MQVVKVFSVEKAPAKTILLQPRHGDAALALVFAFAIAVGNRAFFINRQNKKGFGR